jgi:transmembrane sensor
MSRTAPQATLEERAAEVFLQLRGDGSTAQQIEEALDWLQASPQHESAVARVEALWKLTEQLPRPHLPVTMGMETGRDPARDPQTQAPQWPGRRRHWIPMAMAASILIAALGTLVFIRYPQPAPNLVRYASMVGENRTVKLEDGSEIILGGASEVSVEFTPESRHVILSDGEAFFKVAPNRTRPFVVRSAGGETRAVGTQFDVHRGLEGVTVNVIEGIVQVQSVQSNPGSPASAPVQLGAGSQVSYSTTGDIGAIERAPAERVLAWRSGKLIFVNSSLAEVVSDLNRYSHRPVRMDGDALKELRFTGVIMSDQIPEWLRALQSGSSVKVLETDQEFVLVSTANRKPKDKP